MEVKHSNKTGGSDVTHVIGNDHLLAAQKYLEEQGLSDEWTVILPDDKMLMLDYDNQPTGAAPFLPEIFFATLGILEQIPGHGNQTYYKSSVSKGGNTHVIVYLTNPMSIVERIAWQAAFGSDPKREALHMLSVAVGEKNPILLFERKDEPCSGLRADGTAVIQASHYEVATPQKLLEAGVPTLLLGEGNAEK